MSEEVKVIKSSALRRLIVEDMLIRVTGKIPSKDAISWECGILMAHLRLKHSHHLALYTEEELALLKR